MLTNDLKIAFRSLRKRGTYSLLNVTGLGVGMACAILVMIWVRHELSYDRFHEHAGEIYRVVGDDPITKKIAVTCGPLAEALKNGFPEVVNATRYMQYAGSPFKYDDKLFNESKGAFADPAFFEMFSFRFIRGNPGAALSNPSNIVITESMAKRYFGVDDPLGKTLLVDGKSPVIVSAVIEDPPSQSQLQFNFVMNVMVLQYIGFPLNDWSSAGLHTFVQIAQHADIRKVDAQIADVMPRHIPGFARTMFLQPLTEIHLTTDFASDLPGLGDRKYVYIFSTIGLFILLIACINYVNLSTARIIDRSTDVGVRKTFGSSRAQLVMHFLVDSALNVAIAAGVALVLVELSLPEFSRLSGIPVMSWYRDAQIWIGVIAIVSLACLLSGLYPAFHLSSLNPITALREMSGGRRGSFMRKSLVVAQFSLSIALIAGAGIVRQQLGFVREKKLGFDKSNILYFSAKGDFRDHYDVLKNELLRHSSISGVTAEDKLMLNMANSTDRLDWEGKESKTYVVAEFAFVDRNYFTMLGVEFKEGRSFSPETGADRDGYILNEEAVKQMGIEAPVGKRFSLNGRQGVVVGVIKNVNFKSLHHRVDPAVYSVLADYAELSFTYNGTILVRTVTGKTDDAIASIASLWRSVNPDVPFEYHFLDESIENQYRKENDTAEFVGISSAMAVIISCLGLYGLTSFETENRTKEIGVRKVLGASIPEIVVLLSKDMTKGVIVANLIAWPSAYFIMSNWLKDFAYRVDISAWVFACSGILALVIAVVTVGSHAVKAAAANPVKSLRYE